MLLPAPKQIDDDRNASASAKFLATLHLSNGSGDSDKSEGFTRAVTEESVLYSGSNKSKQASVSTNVSSGRGMAYHYINMFHPVGA